MGRLARHHRRTVDDFVEAVLDAEDLDGMEPNVLGLALRSELDTRLTPGLFAVAALPLGRMLMRWRGCRYG